MSDPVGTGEGNPARVDTEHPWPGLVSFEETNSEFFFGRETEIAEMERLVTNGPVSVLFGRSGLGKTSLLRAGVFPRLRLKNYLPIYVRLNYSDGSPPLVEQTREALWSGLQSAKIEARPPDPEETLWEYCQRDDVDFWDARIRLITPVLVFDQFEEIFTLGRKSHNVERDRERFKEELQALINNSPPERVREKFKRNPELVGRFDFEKRTVKVLISLREDYLPDLDALRTQFHGLGQNRMRLEPLTGRQAREVILKPGQGLVDEPVADRIIEFVSRDKTRGEHEPLILENRVVEPALLSVVCRELNQRRLDSGQAAITAEILSGAKEQILNEFYHRAMGDIPQPVREFVEDNLLTADGYRDRYAQSDALTIPGVTEEALTTLVNRRLLRQEPANGVTWLELTHDLLTGVVQQSRARREQRQAEEARLREHREAEEALLRARRAVRRSRLVAACMTGLAVGAFVLLCSVFSLLKSANKAKDEARTARDEATNQVLEASRDDQATAEEMFDEGEWGRGLAYLGQSLKENPANSDAAIHFWSAVVYGRRGDGRLPEPDHGFTNDSKATYAVLDSAGGRVLVFTNKGMAILITTDGKTSWPLTSLTDSVQKAVFSPDGKRLLTISSSEAVQIWDAANGSLSCTLSNVPAKTLGAAFSPDGTHIVLTGLDGSAAIWDVTKSFPEKPLLTHPGSGWLYAAAFSPDGKLVAAGGLDKMAWVWDTDDKKLKYQLSGHKDWIMAVAFNIDSRHLATASADKTARIWDLDSTDTDSSATVTNSIELHHDARVLMAVFSPDGERLLTATADGTARIWNATNGVKVSDLLQHKARVLKAVFSANDGGKTLLTTSADNTVHLWDATNGNPLGEPLQLGRSDRLLDAVFEAPGDSNVVTTSAAGSAVWNVDFKPPGLLLPHPAKVWSVRFSPDGSNVVTACADGIARVWNLASADRQPLPSFGLTNEDLSKAFRYAEFSPNGKLIVTASEDGFAALWNATNGSFIVKFGGPSNPVRFASFSPNNDRVVTSSLSTNAAIWNLNADPPSFILLSHSNSVVSAFFSPDGTRVVTGSWDRKVKIWDASQGANQAAVICTLTNGDEVNYARFSPDGSRVVTACSDGTAQIWNARTGEKEGPPLKPAENAKMMMTRFSPDSRSNLVVTGSDDGTVRIWNYDSGRVRTLRHNDRVNSVEFSPDGEFVVSSSIDGTARLWKIADGRPASYCEPLPHHGEVVQACFSPDGKLVATASEDGTAGIWRVPRTVPWVFSTNSNLTAGAPLSITNVGEALTAAISGYHFDAKSGQLQQLTIDERLKLKEILDKPDVMHHELTELFRWWERPPENRPSWPDP